MSKSPSANVVPYPVPDSVRPVTPPGYKLEAQVGHLIRRAHQRASSIFQTTIGDPQITPTQYAALVKLHDVGELSQNHLGRLTAMDPATTQGVIRRLRERDLIAARPDPNDRRRTLLKLTPAGNALLARLIVNGPKVSELTLERLSPEEQRTFLALLQRLT
jgi:DNA-binding MarR family transcriptional regulator